MPYGGEESDRLSLLTVAMTHHVGRKRADTAARFENGHFYSLSDNPPLNFYSLS